MKLYEYISPQVEYLEDMLDDIGEDDWKLRYVDDIHGEVCGDVKVEPDSAYSSTMDLLLEYVNLKRCVALG